MVPDVRPTPIRTPATRSFYGAAHGRRRHERGRPALRRAFAAFGKKLGFVTPELYLNSACFHDVIHGDNGAFRGRMGADPCTGLRSPLGEILEERIQPAAIQARRVRALLAENACLHPLIAGKRERGQIAWRNT